MWPWRRSRYPRYAMKWDALNLKSGFAKTTSNSAIYPDISKNWPINNKNYKCLTKKMNLIIISWTCPNQFYSCYYGRCANLKFAKIVISIVVMPFRQMCFYSFFIRCVLSMRWKLSNENAEKKRFWLIDVPVGVGVGVEKVLRRCVIFIPYFIFSICINYILDLDCWYCV